MSERDDCATMQPYSSTMTARTDVVPLSSAMMYDPPNEYTLSTRLRSFKESAIVSSFLVGIPRASRLGGERGARDALEVFDR